MSQIEIIEVNKFECNWLPECLFMDFAIRIILRNEDNFIARINYVTKLRRRLIADIGPENQEWMLTEQNDIIELYLKNCGILVMWKLQNFTEFLDTFESVQHHSVDLQE